MVCMCVTVIVTNGEEGKGMYVMFSDEMEI